MLKIIANLHVDRPVENAGLTAGSSIHDMAPWSPNPGSNLVRPLLELQLGAPLNVHRPLLLNTVADCIGVARNFSVVVHFFPQKVDDLFQLLLSIHRLKRLNPTLQISKAVQPFSPKFHFLLCL